MTYAAEPYAQFVDDLLMSLTGGVARERFTFVPDALRYQLGRQNALGPETGTLVPSTLNVFGLVDMEYARFQIERDFRLTTDFAVEWLANADGTRAADATWPDDGTVFFANYDVVGVSNPAPLLNDRNPGSVVRLLAESFAREFTVLSRQLQSVYEPGETSIRSCSSWGSPVARGPSPPARRSSPRMRRYRATSTSRRASGSPPASPPSSCSRPRKAGHCCAGI